jgi:hypothetical protein
MRKRLHVLADQRLAATHTGSRPYASSYRPPNRRATLEVIATIKQKEKSYVWAADAGNCWDGKREVMGDWVSFGGASGMICALLAN